MNVIRTSFHKHFLYYLIFFVFFVLFFIPPISQAEQNTSNKSQNKKWVCIEALNKKYNFSYTGAFIDLSKTGPSKQYFGSCIGDNAWLVINEKEPTEQYFCFNKCFQEETRKKVDECIDEEIKTIVNEAICRQTINGQCVTENGFMIRGIRTGQNSGVYTKKEIQLYLEKYSKCPVLKNQCITFKTLDEYTKKLMAQPIKLKSAPQQTDDTKANSFFIKNIKKIVAAVLLAQDNTKNKKNTEQNTYGLYSCNGDISNKIKQAIGETQGFDSPQPPTPTGPPPTAPTSPAGQAGTGAGTGSAGAGAGNGNDDKAETAIRDILGNGGKEETTQTQGPQGHTQGTGDKQGDTGNGTAGTSFGGPAGKTPPSNPGESDKTPPPPPADKPDTKKPDVKTPEEKNQNGLLAYLKDKNEQLFGKTNSETETKNTQNTQNSDGGLLSSIFGNTFAYLAQNQNSQNNYEYAREKKFEKVSYADKKTATSSDLWKALFGDRIQDSVKERELQKATKLEEKFKHEMETQGEILKTLPKVELKDDKLVLTNDKPQNPENFLGFLKDKEKVEKRLEQIAESAGFKYLYYKQNEVEVYDQNGEKIVQIKVENGKKRVGLAKEDGTVVFVPEGGILDDKNSWQAFTDAFVQIAGRLPQTEVQGPNTETKIYPYEIALKELYGAEAIEDGISLDPENPFMTVGKDGIKIPLFVLEAAQEKAEQVRGILNLKQEIKQISNGHVNIIKTSEFLSQAEIDIDDIKKIKIPTVSQNALYFAKLKKELIKRGHVNITDKINLAILNSYNLALKKTTGVVAYTIRVDQNGNPIENSTKKYFALADVVSSFFAEATSIFDDKNQNPLLKILSLFVPPTKDAPENRVIRVDDLPTDQPQNITDAIAKVIIKPIVWIKNLLFGF